jgi:hypothetical protein
VDGQDLLGVHGFAKETKSERKSLPFPSRLHYVFVLKGRGVLADMSILMKKKN